MNDTRSRTLRSKLVDLSVEIAQESSDLPSPESSDRLIDLEEELDRTIEQLEAHEGREICLRDELDAAPPAQVIALIEPFRDRLVSALSTSTSSSDRAILESALAAVEAKIQSAVRELVADKRTAC